MSSDYKEINGKAHTIQFYNFMNRYFENRKKADTHKDCLKYFSSIGGKALDEDAYIKDFNRVRIEGSSNRVIFLRKKYDKQLEAESKVLKNKTLLIKDIEEREYNSKKPARVYESNDNYDKNAKQNNNKILNGDSNEVLKRNIARNILSPMKDRPNLDTKNDILTINKSISRNKSCDFVNKIHRQISPRLQSPKMNSYINLF